MKSFTVLVLLFSLALSTVATADEAKWSVRCNQLGAPNIDNSINDITGVNIVLTEGSYTLMGVPHKVYEISKESFVSTVANKKHASAAKTFASNDDRYDLSGSRLPQIIVDTAILDDWKHTALVNSYATYEEDSDSIVVKGKDDMSVTTTGKQTGNVFESYYSILKMTYNKSNKTLKYDVRYAGGIPPWFKWSHFSVLSFSAQCEDVRQ